MTASYRPEGWPSVAPRIFVERATELVDFIHYVFDARGDFNGDRPAEVWIGDSVLLISGTSAREAASAFLYVYVPDTDAAYARAIERGASSLEEPLTTAYGDRRCMVADPFGNTWQIATRISEA